MAGDPISECISKSKVKGGPRIVYTCRRIREFRSPPCTACRYSHKLVASHGGSRTWLLRGTIYDTVSSLLTTIGHPGYRALKDPENMKYDI